MDWGAPIELKPGLSSGPSARPDWSPNAKPAGGTSDLLVHTPDDRSYHKLADGRTMLPRATLNGASRGFSLAPGIVRVVDYEGTHPPFQLDMAAVAHRDTKAAFVAADGDPLRALQLLGDGQPSTVVSEQHPRVPPPMSGYVVPASVTGGAQMTTSGAGDMTARPDREVLQSGLQNPSVRARESAMPAPQMIHEDSLAPAPAAPLVVAPPAAAPAVAVGSDTVQHAMLLLLQQMSERLRLPAPATAPPVETEAKKSPSNAAAEQNGEPTPVHADDTGLSFLTNPPSKPTIQVVFNMGAGGCFSTRFHHVETRGMLLSLIYDTRYDGDQFIPPVTPESGPPIKITFPRHGDKSVQAIVPADLHQRIGCLDVLNFIVVNSDEDKASNA